MTQYSKTKSVTMEEMGLNVNMEETKDYVEIAGPVIVSIRRENLNVIFVISGRERKHS